jgi:hypothetical protein
MLVAQHPQSARRVLVVVSRVEQDIPLGVLNYEEPHRYLDRVRRPEVLQDVLANRQRARAENIVFPTRWVIPPAQTIVQRPSTAQSKVGHAIPFETTPVTLLHGSLLI